MIPKRRPFDDGNVSAIETLVRLLASRSIVDCALVPSSK